MVQSRERKTVTGKTGPAKKAPPVTRFEAVASLSEVKPRPQSRAAAVKAKPPTRAKAPETKPRKPSKAAAPLELKPRASAKSSVQEAEPRRGAAKVAEAPNPPAAVEPALPAELAAGEYPPKVQFILEVLDDMKAIDVETYHVFAKTILADYFIICTGSSSTHTNSISDDVYRRCKKHGWFLGRMEGQDNPSWKILDYGDVVLHVFLEETREFYKLEEIWGEGRKVTPPDQAGPVFERLLVHPRAGSGATTELKRRRNARTVGR